MGRASLQTTPRQAADNHCYVRIKYEETNSHFAHSLDAIPDRGCSRANSIEYATSGTPLHHRQLACCTHYSNRWNPIQYRGIYDPFCI